MPEFPERLNFTTTGEQPIYPGKQVVRFTVFLLTGAVMDGPVVIWANTSDVQNKQKRAIKGRILFFILFQFFEVKKWVLPPGEALCTAPAEESNYNSKVLSIMDLAHRHLVSAAVWLLSAGPRK
ncbi:MAG: hypothetical protein JNL13_04645 [Chitinophagaceae bacterium]|nr:hypothetical protein [Chitinophagaceae bacterium]